MIEKQAQKTSFRRSHLSAAGGRPSCLLRAIRPTRSRTEQTTPLIKTSCTISDWPKADLSDWVEIKFRRLSDLQMMVPRGPPRPDDFGRPIRPILRSNVMRRTLRFPTGENARGSDAQFQHLDHATITSIRRCVWNSRFRGKFRCVANYPPRCNLTIVHMGRTF